MDTDTTLPNYIIVGLNEIHVLRHEIFSCNTSLFFRKL